MLPVKHFTEFIKSNGLFDHNSRILAAVSGGMDSVVMSHLFKSAGFNFSIAHCNFQLRGNEALSDQAFCSSLADRLQAPFHTINFDTAGYAASHKISIQMAARQLRYQWFEQLRQQSGYDVVALAHHQNDAIETILLNLTRGTGIAGVHGILPKNGTLVRPLLFLSRDEIKQIAEQNNLAYAEDSSNTSVKYARNKIRLEVIPKLKALNPALEQTFEKNLERFRELETLLDENVSLLRQKLFAIVGDEVHIPIAGIKELRPLRLLLFKLLQEYGFNETTIGDIIASLDKHAGRRFESGAYTLITGREYWMIVKKDCENVDNVTIRLNDRELRYAGRKLTVLHDDSPLIVSSNPMAASVDTELLIYPLTLRRWQRGDRFCPLGMHQSKKLSDFFVDQKVPLHIKNTIPLLVNGNGEIIWIGGYRLDERYKVSAKTKKVTIFELN
jgi:tRNA(Ile)-lysidine synthase